MSRQRERWEDCSSRGSRRRQPERRCMHGYTLDLRTRGGLRTCQCGLGLGVTAWCWGSRAPWYTVGMSKTALVQEEAGWAVKKYQEKCFPRKHIQREIEENEAPKRHKLLHPGERDRMFTDLIFKLSAASTIQNYNLGEGILKSKWANLSFCKIHLLSSQTKDGITWNKRQSKLLSFVNYFLTFPPTNTVRKGFFILEKLGTIV